MELAVADAVDDSVVAAPSAIGCVEPKQVEHRDVVRDDHSRVDEGVDVGVLRELG